MAWKVFGKTIICPSLQIAGGYTRSHGLNAITLDGDKVDRKGALSGGYHDIRRSRLDVIREVKQRRVKYEADLRRSEEVRRTGAQLDQQITQLVGKIQSLETRRRQAQQAREPLINELNLLQRDEDEFRARLERLATSLADRQLDLRSLKANLASHQAELQTPMASRLSDEEEATLTRLTSEIEAQKRELIQLTTSVSEVCFPGTSTCQLPCSRDRLRFAAWRPQGDARVRAQRESEAPS
jgi:structural maintenance of chromosome 3 (chondroitin sulfate proteoglycan 6)